MKKIYTVTYKSENDVELLDTVMSIFSLTVLKKPLSLKERTVLREYILNGYSSEVKKDVRFALGITDKNLNTLNCTLQKKGFLRPHPTNQRLKNINDDLLKIKDVFLAQGDKVLLIKFKDANN